MPRDSWRIGILLTTLLVAACTGRSSSAEIDVTSAPSPSVVTVAQPLGSVSFVDLRSGRVTPLPHSISSFGDVGHVEASPDGSLLAFEAEVDGVSQLFVVGIDGRRVKQLTHVSAAALIGGWSPDSRRIVFATDNMEKSRILAINVRSGDVAALTTPGFVFAPSFGDGGRTILYSWTNGNQTALWTAPARGGASTRLMEYAGAGSISPDGTRLAFHQTAPFVCGMCLRVELTVAASDGSGSLPSPYSHDGSVELASRTQYQSIWARWSPTGRFLVYRDLGGDDATTIHVMNVRSGRIVDIGVGRDPSWANEHTLIVGDWEGVE